MRLTTVLERVDNYYEQGLSLLDEGKFEQAIMMFDKAIKLSLGNLPEIYVCRGEALAYLGRWQDAEKSINQALRHQPYMAAAYNERGNIRRFQNKMDDAITDYTMAINIDPVYYEAYYNRALAYEEKKRFQEAEDDLTRTLALNPTISQAYEARGRTRAAQSNYDGAIDDLIRYLRVGAGHKYDNHSEVQGYVFVLRLKRLFWNVFRKRNPKS